ncbi:hypothetical protein [Nostoc sp. FACHB-888]|uniref:hypothetical protein n=1 Tax=Nostoc sp. FACHB-888 TaxID=2692842 RepID=UPI00198AA42B|nr:hypothetical protein [Nostoc sp. FACHB-888]MBD2249325.1 hypothetical protein [Nostoc sp. FACHB-888]
MANFNVTNINDTGAGSLRDAITQANNTNGADTISFTGTTFEDNIADTITLTSGELIITDTIIINGKESSNLTISGNNASRVFNVNDQDSNNQIKVEVTGLTITGGTSVDNGGGILNLENLTINSSTISSNSAFSGAGIANFGTANINSSTISSNSTTEGVGGGVANGGMLIIDNSTIAQNSSLFGGGINNFGRIIISNSTLSSNQSDKGGGINNTGKVTVSNSTISKNSAVSDSDIFVFGTDTITSSLSGDTFSGNGGGVFNSIEGKFTLLNSIVFGNQATGSGGGIFNSSQVTLINSIVTNNTADSDNNGIGKGGGISNDSGIFSASNTIIAANKVIPDNLGLGTVNPNIGGNISGGTNNFIGAITSASTNDLLVSGVDNGIVSGSENCDQLFSQVFSRPLAELILCYNDWFS